MQTRSSGPPDSSLESDDKSPGDSQTSGKDMESRLSYGDNVSSTGPPENEVADHDIVDWDGPDDPANPMNWKSTKKLGAIGIVSLITILSPLASTMIAPASAEVLAAFGSADQTLGAFITSIYLLGYSTGPLIIAPLSELYGRAIVYNVCNTIFLIFTIACAVANNLAALIVFRLFAGIAASCPITLGAGSIADMIPLEKRGLAMAAWIAGPVLGPTFGPLAGGYLAQAKGWRWIFWLISILAGAVWVISVLFMPESYAYVILKHKTQHLRAETGNLRLRSALESGKSPAALFKFSIVRPLKMLFLSPIVFLLSLYAATVYGYTYLLFTTLPRVFEGQYQFSRGSVGLTYLGSGIGSLLGLIFCGAVSDRLVAHLTRRNGGSAQPEYRLPTMFLGALVVPAGLFLYGWTAEARVHWIVPIIGTGMLGVGLFLVFMPVATYLVDAYTTYAASVSAASTVFRSLLGALLPLAGNSMYDALGLGWGTSLLGFIAVAFIPLPLILWRYGKRIRGSKICKVNF